MAAAAVAPPGSAQHVSSALPGVSLHDAPLVLVSGVSGYIGIWVAKTLLVAGFRVRGTVRSLANAKKIAPVTALQKAFPAGQLQLVEADLERPESWPAAVAGCTYVQHVASPFPLTVPRSEDEINALIRTAVSGTVNVLTACAAATPQPRRVIVTSSIAAIMGTGGGPRPFDEGAWTDTGNPAVSPYFKSKTLAERAAWNFVARKAEAGEPVFELATVHPGYVMGPMLTTEQCTSAEPLRRMLTGGMPLVPDVPFNCVDVRDVARGHVLAMLRPEAAGGRHLLVGFDSNLRDMADILARHFTRLGYGVATGRAPDCLIRCGSTCDPALKQVVPSLGKVTRFDTSRTERVLGMSWTAAKDRCVSLSTRCLSFPSAHILLCPLYPVPPAGYPCPSLSPSPFPSFPLRPCSIEDMAYSMLENGLVPNKLPKDHAARMLGREWLPHADGLVGAAAVMTAATAAAAAAGAAPAAVASTAGAASAAVVAAPPSAALDTVLGSSSGGASKDAAVPHGAASEAPAGAAAAAANESVSTPAGSQSSTVPLTPEAGGIAAPAVVVSMAKEEDGAAGSP